MIKISCLLSGLSFFLSSLTLCDAQGGGGAGAFLVLAGDALKVGMGGAAVAVPDHGSVLTTNPAGMAFLEERGISASYRFLSLDRRHSTISYTHSLASGAGFGVGWISAGVGDIEGRDLNGRRTGNIGDSENAFLFAFSKGLGRHGALGLTFTLLNHRLGGRSEASSATGFGLDLGIVGRLTERWVVGIAAHNLRAHLSWKTPVEDRSSQTRDVIPVRWTLGGAYTTGHVLMTAEGEWTEDTGGILRTGMSWTMSRSFTVMTGIGRSSGEERWMTPAFGCAVRRPWNGTVEIRYAYNSDPIDAGGGHVLTVVIGW
ncbi:MAG: hypothetical protein HY709_05715 [Candidatus Latescibacteria bacterium]|nr:hypothetical protein [Candidatus Latescibacterota bacterium]